MKDKAFWEDLLKQKERELAQIKRALSIPAQLRSRRIPNLQDEIAILKQQIDWQNDREREIDQALNANFVIGIYGQVILPMKRSK